MAPCTTSISTADALQELPRRFLAIYREHTGDPLPADPYEQLERSIGAVFQSWNGKRAVDYRRQFRITPAMANGTAVNVVHDGFGNMGNDSATGVGFTRNPAPARTSIYGEYLVNAQGEDVVAGIRTPKPIAAMAQEMPDLYRELVELRDKLEAHYKEVQDFEFTIERGRLYCLQTRNGKMNARAMVTTSVEMVGEGSSRRSGPSCASIRRCSSSCSCRTLDPKHRGEAAGAGSAGVARRRFGRIVFDADTAEQRGKQARSVILVREETKPEDIHGFFAAQGILTSRGGKTSHAAVVARGMGKPCVSGCDAICDRRARAERDRSATRRFTKATSSPSTARRAMSTRADPDGRGPILRRTGDAAVLGRRGRATRGSWPMPTRPRDAARARQYGAMGIGLCRTERMFNDPQRLPIVQEMILADTPEARRAALDKLLPIQRADFKGIFKAMAGLPVTVRLLDPPMHEFLPTAAQLEFEISHLRNLQRTARSVADLPDTLKLLDPELPRDYVESLGNCSEASRGTAKRTATTTLLAQPEAMLRKCTLLRKSIRCSGTAASGWASPIPRSTRCRSGRSSRPRPSAARKASKCIRRSWCRRLRPPRSSSA